MRGKVTFVGAGCGDPRLLTLRAAEVLATADVALFDPEVHPDVLARLPERTPRHAVTSGMTAEAVASQLAAEAKQGKSAVRLAWGDPLLFAGGDAECAAVARHGVTLEVIPGIGPLDAVGAYAGLSLTRSRDASPSVAAVVVTRGHESLHDWSKLATATDTLVLLCDADVVSDTARSLVFHGRPSAEDVTLVEGLSLPSQRVTTMKLGELPLLTAPLSGRVVLVAGRGAARIPALAWTSAQPLFGKRVLVTRAREQAGSAAAMFRERGADPVVVPTIEIHPPTDPALLTDAVQAMGERYDWVVVTSANGVEHLWAEIRRQGKDARAFGKARLAAIGPGTAAALGRCGLTPDRVAKEHRQEGLAAELHAAIQPGAGPRPRVLLARAEVARDVLPETLRAAGCEVDLVPVYRTLPPPRPLLAALSLLLQDGELDVVTFTSSSTVAHLCDALGERAVELLSRTCVASIGPVTTEAAEKRGIRVDVSATEYTIAGLVSAIEKHFTK